MENKQIIKDELTGNECVYIKHKSGLDIFVCEMEGYSTVDALFGTKYGSINTCFKTANDKEYTTVPEGIAHFLEHKLFENEDNDVFELYAKTGASANAYTSFDRTCYVFTCSDNYEESLKILLEFVQSPYFTQETVDKEQGIIAQEINPAPLYCSNQIKAFAQQYVGNRIPVTFKQHICIWHVIQRFRRMIQHAIQLKDKHPVFSIPEGNKVSGHIPYIKGLAASINDVQAVFLPQLFVARVEIHFHARIILLAKALIRLMLNDFLDTVIQFFFYDRFQQEFRNSKLQDRLQIFKFTITADHNYLCSGRFQLYFFD